MQVDELTYSLSHTFLLVNTFAVSPLHVLNFCPLTIAHCTEYGMTGLYRRRYWSLLRLARTIGVKSFFRFFLFTARFFCVFNVFIVIWTFLHLWREPCRFKCTHQRQTLLSRTTWKMYKNSYVFYTAWFTYSNFHVMTATCNYRCGLQ